MAPPEHPLFAVEMFLPILMIARVKDVAAGVALANDSPLGLTAGCYGDEAEVAYFLDHIEAGTTYCNRPQGATTGAWPVVPGVRRLEGLRLDQQGHRLLLLSAAVPARAVADGGRVSRCRCCTPREAIARHVEDGQTIALEGFTHLIPFAAGHEIIRQGRSATCTWCA